MGKHKHKKSSVDLGYVAVVALKANIMAYMVTAIFIILSGLVLTYTNVSQSFEGWLIAIGVICSAFLAGYDMAKIDGKGGYKWGCIGGITYLVLFIILSMLMNGFSTFNLGYMMTVALCALVSSSVAGMFSVNSKNN